MSTDFLTVADSQERLGGIPPERICLHPSPGTATEEDFYAAMDRRDGIYELVDGVLVRKPVGLYESVVALELAFYLQAFVHQHKLGLVAGADGMMKIVPGQIRYPDVSFISWGRLRGHDLRKEKVPRLAPDLAVEVLSESNTKAEMDAKVREYFAGGVSLVWIIDPESESAEVYTAVHQVERIGADGSLSGEQVLPGFEVGLRDLFERARGGKP
jgi:Uma2 family endonuclease